MLTNNFPKLHNAAWPGLVGKGSPGAEPFIDLDTMLDLTAKADVGGVKFDGIDLFLYNPHTDIDISDDGIKALANKIKSAGIISRLRTTTKFPGRIFIRQTDSNAIGTSFPATLILRSCPLLRRGSLFAFFLRPFSVPWSNFSDRCNTTHGW